MICLAVQGYFHCMKAGLISIEYEEQYRGKWIRVFVPEKYTHQPVATLLDEHGNVLRQVSLMAGNNTIDISMLLAKTVAVRVDTAFETLLKEIELTP